MGTHITLENIHKHFGDVEVLTNINLTIQAGQTAAVLGPSGCGKTTLLRIIAGIESVDQGSIFFNGNDVTNVSPQKRHAVLVPQEGALFPHLTVQQNIAFGLTRRSRKKKADWVSTLITDLDLVGLEKRKPAELSGGQASRVAIARALAPLPDLVLLDEPFAALDKNLRESVRLAVRRLARHHDITLVLVTHDQEEALSFAQDIIVLDSGRITGMGAPHKVYRQPPSPGVASFLGEANFVDAVFTNGLAVSEFGSHETHQENAGNAAAGQVAATADNVTGQGADTTADNVTETAADTAGNNGKDTNAEDSVDPGVHSSVEGSSDANELNPSRDYSFEDGTRGKIMIRPEQLRLVRVQDMSEETAQKITIDHVVYHGHDSVIHGVTASGTKLLIRVQHEINLSEPYAVTMSDPVVFYPET